MPTVFIDKLAVPLPSRFAGGDLATEIAAALLNSIQHKRVIAKLRRLLARGEIAEHEVQQKAEAFLQLDLVPYITLDDDPDASDPVIMEALGMAKSLITARMAKEGLPPPKGLEDHARNLVDSMPTIMEAARKRVEARYKAAERVLEGAI
jgi:hypothetical protein